MKLFSPHFNFEVRSFLLIVRSIDIVQRKEYTYTYENGRIVRAAESDITLGANEVITGKTLVNAIVYSYDADDKLTRKRILSADGNEQTVWYENPEDGSPVVKFGAGGKTITAHSKTDSFGRKVFDELQLGTGFVSRQFHYHAGEVTQEHIDAEKLKSTATTQLVSRIVLSNGRTLSYEYDAEERITKVTDSVDGVTEYTYDALGQLLTEKYKAVSEDAFVTVNEMTYDNYGNIVSKNGKTYTYDSTWKDLLISCDGQTITYDAQGNPTSYLGHTLIWERGRQLKSFLSNLRWMYGSVIYNNIGLIGISPVSVTNYLRIKFWFICKASSITFLWGIKAELSRAVIVLYQHRGWNSSFHYVAGIKTGSGYGGSFGFYNDRYYKDRYGVKSISIWKYIDLLKANGCKPLMLWGVAGKFGWW